MKNPLRVLIVEDSEDDTFLTLRELQSNGYAVTYDRVDTEEKMAAALTSAEWDVILSDYSMPNFSALAALKLAQTMKMDLPFIIISGTVGEDAAVAAMKLGAHDFFPKSKLTRLVPAIEREMQEAEQRRAHRLVAQKLRQSEERFAKAFRASPIGMSIMTNQGTLLDVNEQILNLFEYQPDEIVGRTLLELSIWVDLETRTKIENVFNGEESIRDLVVKCRTRTGKLRDVLISVETISLDNETRKLTLFHDITELKQVQNELNSLYNATSYLFNADGLLGLGQQIVKAVTEEFGQVDCGVLLVDRDQNRMIRLVRGGESPIEADSILTLDGKGLVPEAVKTGHVVYVPDVSLDSDYVPNVSETRSELVVPLRTAKGVLGVLDLQSTQLAAFSERDLRILSAFAERAASAIESMQLYEEINRHAAELEWRVAQRTVELQQAKEHVEAILNNSSDAIILVNPEGLIQQTNQAFSNLFGYPRDEVYQQSLVRFFEPNQREKLLEAFQMVAAGKPTAPIELVGHHHDERAFNAEMTFASVANRKQGNISIICNLRDVTQHKLIEEGLRTALLKEKEVNDLKTSFVSMVSHEFRTPLAVIQSSVEIVTHYGERLTDERKSQHLAKVAPQVKHLTGLLDEVLILSKAGTVGLPFNPIPVELDALCGGLVENAQLTTEKHRIQFSIIPNDHPAVLADPKLLTQSINNLLSNAIKYSPDGGTIWLDVVIEQEEIIFHVKDEGIGIPADDQKRMFEIFHRAGNVGTIAGTGLGLAIVRGFMDAHGGSINFETRIGEGTTFTLSIPKMIP